MKKLSLITAVLAMAASVVQAQTTFSVSGGDMRDALNWTAGLPTNGVVGTVGVDGVLPDEGSDEAYDLVGWTIVQTNGTVSDNCNSYLETEYRGVDIDVQGGTWYRNATVRMHEGTVFKVSGGTATMNNGMIAFPGGFKVTVSSGSLISRKATNYNSTDTSEKSITVTGGSAEIGVATSDTSKPIDEANVFFNVTDGSLAMYDLTYAGAADDTNIVVTIGDNAAFVTHKFDLNDNATARADRYINLATDDITSSWQWVGKVAADFEAKWNQGTLRRTGESGLDGKVFEDYITVVDDTAYPAPPIPTTIFTDTSGDGTWANAANWTDGVPDFTTVTFVSSNLTANLSGGDGFAKTLNVGADGLAGAVTNGSLTVARAASIGYGDNTIGLVEVVSFNAGTDQYDARIGSSDGASGRLSAGAGTLTGRSLYVADGTDAFGAVDMGSGSISMAAPLYIATGANSTGTVDAATLSMLNTNGINIATASNAYGRVTLGGGTLTLNSITMADSRDSVGELDVGAATLTIANGVSIGQGRDSVSSLTIPSPIVLASTNYLYIGSGVGSSTDVEASDFSIVGPVGTFGVGEGTPASIKNLLAANDSVGAMWINTDFTITAGTHEITGLNIGNQDDAVNASFAVAGGTVTYSGDISIASGNNTAYDLDLATIVSGVHTAGAINVARGDYSVASLVYTNDDLFLTGTIEVGTGGENSSGEVVLKSLSNQDSTDALSVAIQGGAAGSTGTVTILEDAYVGVCRVARGEGSVGTLTVGGTLDVWGLYLNVTALESNAVGVLVADSIYKTNNVGGSIQMSQGEGCDGTMIASAGHVIGNTMQVATAANSTGVLEITNGMATVKTIQFATAPGAVATVLIGITSSETNDVNIGTASNAVGTLTMPSGTLAAANLNLGSADGGVGSITLAGGNLVVAGTIGGGAGATSFIDIADGASEFTWVGRVEADFIGLWDAGMLRSNGKSGLTGATFSDYFTVAGDVLSAATVLPIGDIVIAGPIAGGGMILSWDSVDGQAYNVEIKGNLVYGSWTNHTSGIIGTGGELSVTTAVDQAASFYRVISN